MSRLVEIVTALDERPALEETDALLVELQKMPRDDFVSETIDALLDYRMLLAQLGEVNGSGGPSSQARLDD